jgi:hypothetical protein
MISKKIMDGRNQSYITYEIEVIIYMMILKNVCSIASMQEMNDEFNEDTCIKNLYKILGLEEKEYLPHYVTVKESVNIGPYSEIEGNITAMTLTIKEGAKIKGSFDIASNLE